LSGDTPFPGVAALLPTLGTAAVILAGSATRMALPTRLLGVAPVRYVGRISYAWYLWHWPLLAFAGAIWGPLTAWEGLLVVAASLVPTVLTHHLIENPVRHARLLVRKPVRALQLGAGCMAVAIGASLVVPLTAQTVAVAASTSAPGAAAEHGGLRSIQHTARALRPTPQQAAHDAGPKFAQCLGDRRSTQVHECVGGDPSSSTRLVLFGDSHAMQYFPALTVVAAKRGWRLEALAKTGCIAADVHQYNGNLGRPYRECDAWRRKALSRIERERPQLVIVAGFDRPRAMHDGTRLSRQADASEIESGYVTSFRRLRATGAHVIFIRDNPDPPMNVSDCLARNAPNVDECTFDRKSGLMSPVGAHAAAKTGVTVLDPLDVLCTKTRCPTVIGSVIVYWLDDHLTATFVHTLVPWLDDQLPSAAAVRRKLNAAGKSDISSVTR
jgi:hypothetical protein